MRFSRTRRAPPFGHDSNGGSAFWLTEGQPDEWPLIFYPREFCELERYSMPLVAFLGYWVSGNLSKLSEIGPWKYFVNKTDPVFRNHWKKP